MDELVRHQFEVHTINDADEREDTFYTFKHEPPESYSSTIKEIKGNRALFRCNGIAIIDGYVQPYTKDRFEFDCWLPIITNFND